MLTSVLFSNDVITAVSQHQGDKNGQRGSGTAMKRRHYREEIVQNNVRTFENENIHRCKFVIIFMRQTTNEEKKVTCMEVAQFLSENMPT